MSLAYFSFPLFWSSFVFREEFLILLLFILLMKVEAFFLELETYFIETSHVKVSNKEYLLEMETWKKY